MNLSDGEILAFCHIEKAAGTSIINVLRQLFVMHYADARPLTRGHGNMFSREDFSLFGNLMPKIACIGGHSVVPYSDLAGADKKFRFVTLLRDPVSRVISHYKFWVQRMGSDLGAEEFLQHPVANNFQVMKIAGTIDLVKAKTIICEHFLLIGTIEKFEEFLVVLASRLGVPLTQLSYEQKNISDYDQVLELPVGFRERIAEINLLDRELYSWVQNELVPEYIRKYGTGFDGDLREFRRIVNIGKNNMSWLPTAAIRIFRHAYLKPVTGAIRIWNGLPYAGTYGD